MANLAAETKDMGFQLEQVQGFTPTPMTVATIIYYTGYHPYYMQQLYTAKSKKEKEDQHRFFFWYKKENKQWIKDRLTKARRPDLIAKLIEEEGKGKSTKTTSFHKTPRRKKPSRQNKRGKK